MTTVLVVLSVVSILLYFYAHHNKIQGYDMDAFIYYIASFIIGLGAFIVLIRILINK